MTRADIATCMKGGTSNGGKKKWLPKPLAFFIWEEDSSNKKTGGRLMPVAIQLDASTDPVTYTHKESRVWFPNEKNPIDWVFAKICVQVCFCSIDVVLLVPL